MQPKDTFALCELSSENVRVCFVLTICRTNITLEALLKINKTKHINLTLTVPVTATDALRHFETG